MNTQKQEKHTETFEEILLSYVEMCYAVALTLTRDPDDANSLTREVLEGAWHLRNRANATKNIKKTLLIAMRQRFIENYRKPVCTPQQHAVFAERV